MYTSVCVCRGMNLNYCFIPIVLKKFLTHCTGSTYPHPNSIRVDFLGDNYGAISAHTCDKLIMFPRGVFTNESYQLFYDSLMAVIGVDTFNMV